MRYELTDHEWAAIKPMLPNKPRCPTCERPPCPELHLLGLAIWRTGSLFIQLNLQAGCPAIAQSLHAGLLTWQLGFVRGVTP